MTPSTSLETAASLAADASQRSKVLRCGDRIFIRPIRVGDIDLERTFIEGLSIASRRFRFLESMSSPSPALLKQLTSINPATDVAYVAVRDGDASDLRAARCGSR